MDNQIKFPGALAEALAKAQGEIKTPLKTQKVSFGNREYWYADLAGVIDAIRLPLCKNNIALSQKICTMDGQWMLVTALLHNSNEQLDSFYPLPDPSKVKPQEFGSALTYARRYSISALVGIASEDDDDGQNAAKPDKSHIHMAPTVHHKDPNEALAKAKEESEFNQTPQTPLDELIRFAKEKKLPAEVMKTIIKRVIGADLKSTELSNEEIQKVLEYLKLMK